MAATDVYSAVIQPLPLTTALACAAVAGGAALLNDLDTASSTASHALGWVSRGAARGVQWVAQVAFNLTATPVDARYGSPVHRGLTHTAVAAAVAGVVTWQVARLGWGATLVVALVTTFLALRTLTRCRGIGLLAATLGVATAVALTEPSPPLVGLAVGVGFLSHDALDGCTTMGVPFWWPLRIWGMRWRRVGLPRFLRFRTGTRVESWLTLLIGLFVIASLPPVLGAATNLVHGYLLR